MGTIVDILNIRPRDIGVVHIQYPDCLVLNPAFIDYDTAQKIVIVISEEDENSYYDFLLNNGIAMSSKDFTYRVSHEKLFADRMIERATKLVEGLGEIVN
ncbi:hypothetical protein KP001_07805 [Geomonas subterranea]|uniref:Uncharacterized protein n=1 Tax=Geomonas subterranea TaxID=2847989 RepID=A0ABX8LL44_9BACT|nr:hypothetical protein [Geomonas subterranea]QXE92417.1 hypothetical protein KP001_07805 [Geomonas subterranea]QXM09484.1 hypothetical protein KP002_21465 [Geomonas subterranea]